MRTRRATRPARAWLSIPSATSSSSGKAMPRTGPPRGSSASASTPPASPREASSRSTRRPRRASTRRCRDGFHGQLRRGMASYPDGSATALRAAPRQRRRRAGERFAGQHVHDRIQSNPSVAMDPRGTRGRGRGPGPAGGGAYSGIAAQRFNSAGVAQAARSARLLRRITRRRVDRRIRRRLGISSRTSTRSASTTPATRRRRVPGQRPSAVREHLAERRDRLVGSSPSSGRTRQYLRQRFDGGGFLSALNSRSIPIRRIRARIRASR